MVSTSSIPFESWSSSATHIPSIERSIHPWRSSKTYIACAIANLLRASVGTSVVTFHGFGGRMPPQYRRVLSEQTHGGELALWVRAPHSKRQSNGEFEARPVA